MSSPIDLRRTVNSFKATLFRRQVAHQPDGVYASSRTPIGLGTIRFAGQTANIVCDAWGPGAAWLLDRAPQMLGVDDDPRALTPLHPILKDVHRRSLGVRWGRTSRVMEALVPSIVGQKVTGKGAARSLMRLARTHGERGPGPAETWLLPTPDVLAEMPYWEYHRFDIEKKRADTIRGVAARHVRLERLVDEDLPEVYRVLQAFRGVGPWTAALVAGVALGDVDAVPVGDFHIPNIVAWTLAGEERADDDRMLELLEPYRGQRGRVIRLLESSGIRPPAYGPRNSVRSIRGS